MFMSTSIFHIDNPSKDFGLGSYSVDMLSNAGLMAFNWPAWRSSLINNISLKLSYMIRNQPDFQLIFTAKKIDTVAWIILSLLQDKIINRVQESILQNPFETINLISRDYILIAVGYYNFGNKSDHG